MAKYLIIGGRLSDRVIEVPEPAPTMYTYSYAQPKFFAVITNGDTPVTKQQLYVREETLFLKTFKYGGNTISVYTPFEAEIPTSYYHPIWHKLCNFNLCNQLQK